MCCESAIGFRNVYRPLKTLLLETLGKCPDKSDRIMIESQEDARIGDKKHGQSLRVSSVDQMRVQNTKVKETEDVYFRIGKC